MPSRPITRASLAWHLPAALPVLILILAAGLRLYRIDAQSLWYDEGNSARIAERSLGLIYAGAAADIHPPLYYLLLSLWRAIFGASEAGLRSLSALAGVVTAGLTMWTGRTLFNRRVGLLAGALCALSPFAVYYGQEARMYALLGAEAALSTLALARLGWLGPNPAARPWPWRVVYVISSAAGLYTQYAYPFVLVAQGVAGLLTLVLHADRGRIWRAQLLEYGLANGVAIALFAPWLPIALRQIGAWKVAAQPYVLSAAVADVSRWLAVGRTLPLAESGLAIAVFGGLALIGCLRRRPAGLVLALLLMLPVALLFVFNLYREAYLKFLLVGVSPLCLLAAAGLDKLSSRIPARWTALGATAGLLACMGLVLPSLSNLYFNPAYARDDYRGIARMIEARFLPGDAVLFSAPNQWEVFTFYHPEHIPDTAPPIPLRYHPTAAEVESDMTAIAAQYRRVFVLYFAERESDPDGQYERWLAEHAFKTGDEWVGNIRLAVYTTQCDCAPAELPAAPVAFADGIQLRSARLPKNAILPVGAVLPVELEWLSTQAPAGRYKVFVHVSVLGSAPVAQNDSEPAAGNRPTPGWAAGETILDRRAVWLRPGTPPGQYAVSVGLYDAATGQRAREPIQIGTVTIIS